MCAETIRIEFAKLKGVTYYGYESRTVAIAKYTQGLIGSGKAIRAIKHGMSQASSAIATKLRLWTSSDTAVMTNMVTHPVTMFGMLSKFVSMTENPSCRNERERYCPTGPAGIPNRKPRM